MTVPGLIGFAGVAVYLGAYLALQLGVLAGQSYAYAGFNILAAACVLVSLLDPRLYAEVRSKLARTNAERTAEPEQA